MIDLKPKILDFISKEGPVLPTQVAKVIEKDSFLASAVLSELVSSKKVKLTHAKFGGSKMYYLEGQEYKLSVLYNYLNGREKEAYDLLKSKLILEDSELKPVERVALSEIKDFAVPVIVKNDNYVKKFWKWHLLSDDLAKEKIKKELNIDDSQKKLNEEPKIEVKEVPIPEIKEPVQELKENPQPIEVKEEIPKEKKPRKKAVKLTNDFLNEIESYLNTNNIEVLSKETIKSNSEINLKIKLPTNLGDLTFFVKAKNKKKVSNADLSLAYSEAQQLGLPILFLTTGEPTKKYNDFIDKKLRGQLIFKKINSE